MSPTERSNERERSSLLAPSFSENSRPQVGEQRLDPRSFGQNLSPLCDLLSSGLRLAALLAIDNTRHHAPPLAGQAGQHVALIDPLLARLGSCARKVASPKMLWAVRRLLWLSVVMKCSECLYYVKYLEPICDLNAHHEAALYLSYAVG